MKGFSIILSFGGWGGINILWKGYSMKRICLGYFSIILFPRDFEDWLWNALPAIELGIKDKK